MNRIHIKTSKFLSYVLRHKPEAIGLEIDRAGWAEVDQLISRANQAGQTLTLELLKEVVENNDKKRFAFSEDLSKIRAVQGHSRPVDLALEPVPPPDTLYHGTATRFFNSIMEVGLSPKSRQYVHLSAAEETARMVGQRHGKPVVLRVAAAAMQQDGHKFYLTDNGVWLTESVPPEYLFEGRDAQ